MRPLARVPAPESIRLQGEQTMKFASPAEPELKTIRDVMSTDLVTLNVNDTLRLADDMMNIAMVRHFPVIDGQRLVGLLSQSDLLHASMRSLLRHRADSPRHVLGTVGVREIMKPPITVSADTSLQQAAAILVEKQADCLLVTEGEKLIGLASRTDLLRQMAGSTVGAKKSPAAR
jgi:CBS domain-containing protein